MLPLPIGVELLSNNLYQDALGTSTIKLSVEYLPPFLEIELAIGQGQEH
jgi:hypothetical protein